MALQRISFFLLFATSILLPVVTKSQQPNSSRHNVSLPNRIRLDRAVSESGSNDHYWRGNPESASAQRTLLSARPESESQEVVELNSAAGELSSLEIETSVPTTSSMQGLQDWPRRSIRNIEIDPRDRNDKVPPDRSGPIVTAFARNWSAFESVQKTYCWQAPNIHYQPLYFEDVALERYGQSPDDYWQTAISAAHFFSSAALLPLHFRFDPICGCDYPLGYCRPGICTRKIWQRQIWWR